MHFPVKYLLLLDRDCFFSSPDILYAELIARNMVYAIRYCAGKPSTQRLSVLSYVCSVGCKEPPKGKDTHAGRMQVNKGACAQVDFVKPESQVVSHHFTRCMKKPEVQTSHYNLNNKQDNEMRINYRKTVYRDLVPPSLEPHNTNIRKSAEKYAKAMRNKPSWLEKQMIDFLKYQDIKYQFQKIIYIKSGAGYIKYYYIVDFFFPQKNIILEVDGAFHKNQEEFDEFRTKDIQKYYPKYTVIRWDNKDFRSYSNMKKLISLLK